MGVSGASGGGSGTPDVSAAGLGAGGKGGGNTPGVMAIASCEGEGGTIGVSGDPPGAGDACEGGTPGRLGDPSGAEGSLGPGSAHKATQLICSHQHARHSRVRHQLMRLGFCIPQLRSWRAQDMGQARTWMEHATSCMKQ